MRPSDVMKDIEKNGQVITGRIRKNVGKILAQATSSSAVEDSSVVKQKIIADQLETIKSNIDNRIAYYNNARQENWNQKSPNPQ